MIYAEIPDSNAQQELDDAIKEAKVKSWYVRLLIIALSAKRCTVQKLSEMFSVCQATVRNYIHSYNEGGLDGLQPVKQPGRPPKLAHWTKAAWNRILECTPNQYEKLNTESRQWTLDLLVVYLKEYHNIEVCRSSVYHSFCPFDKNFRNGCRTDKTSLRKTGRGTGRSKLRVGSPDPEYAVKRQQVEAMRNLR